MHLYFKEHDILLFWVLKVWDFGVKAERLTYWKFVISNKMGIIRGLDYEDWNDEGKYLVCYWCELYDGPNGRGLTCHIDVVSK